MRKYYKDNKEKVRAYQKTYYTAEKKAVYDKVWYKRSSNSELRRKYKLKNRYGMSIEDYKKMCDLQNDACAICKRHVVEKLHVDHCHETNKVRGLLCSYCNKGLGCFKDNIENLKTACEYLSRSRL